MGCKATVFWSTYQMLGKRVRARVVESDDEDEASVPRARMSSATMSVTLVASDGGRFDIEAYKLWAASDVLRDAWATSSDAVPAEITFDDGELESSDVIRRFVRYAGGLVVSLPETRDLAKVDALLGFTDKWGCTTVQRHFLADLHRSVLMGKCQSTKGLLRLASKYHNVELAKSVITNEHTVCKPRPQWRVLQKEVAGRDSLDMRTWELGELGDISAEYRWALDRATLGLDWSAKDTDWGRIAKRFEDFLELAQVP